MIGNSFDKSNNLLEVAEGQPTFGIMITTRNRRGDLCYTVDKLNQLNPPPSKVIICADGCTDDTVEAISSLYPEVTLLVNERGQGSVPARDRMLRLMKVDWVLSLDDDSYPLSADFFGRTVELINSHPKVSVFTFPEQRDGGAYASPTKTPQVSGHLVSAYPNCAALMNLNDYMKTAGYPVVFEHNYEEPDYALQIYAIGKTVWFEPSLIIRHHLSSVNRNVLRIHQQNARNELWSVWIRCPWPWLPVVSIFRILRQFQFAWSQGFYWVVREPRWWLESILGLKKCAGIRKPIPWKVYFNWMKLARLKVL